MTNENPSRSAAKDASASAETPKASYVDERALQITFSPDAREILTDACGIAILLSACHEAMESGYASFSPASDFNGLRMVDWVDDSHRESVLSGLITLTMGIALLLVVAAGLFQIARWLI